MAAAGLPQLLSLVGVAFGKAHAAAVAKEASALNSAVPPYVQGVQQVFQAVNAGQLDVTTAQTYIDQLVQAFYSAVSPIMKKGGNCAFDEPLPSPCNGPCSVGCSYIERVSYLGKELLASATPGSVSIQGLGPHAGFQGAPTLTLTLTSIPNTHLPGQPQATVLSNPTADASIVGDINLFGQQIPRGTALLVGGGFAVLLLFALLGSGSSSKVVYVPAPVAGA